MKDIPLCYLEGDDLFWVLSEYEKDLKMDNFIGRVEEEKYVGYSKGDFKIKNYLLLVDNLRTGSFQIFIRKVDTRNNTEMIFNFGIEFISYDFKEVKELFQNLECRSFVN